MVAGVAVVGYVTGSDKPARGPQGVLTIVAKLVSSLAKTAMMVEMEQMAEMGMMEALAA
jgi:hypothetical protein